MELADRFNLPVISLVDTQGAYPGVGAEERGQAEAIARSTQMCLRIGVPMITLVIGEGMVRWCHCHCRGQPSIYARAFHLLGYFA